MSNINVTIKDAAVNVRSGEKNGKRWELREQTGLIELDGETRKVNIALRKDASAFAAGRYVCDLLKQVRFGKYGLELDDRLQLQAVKA